MGELLLPLTCVGDYPRAVAKAVGETLVLPVGGMEKAGKGPQNLQGWI